MSRGEEDGERCPNGILLLVTCINHVSPSLSSTITQDWCLERLSTSPSSGSRRSCNVRAWHQHLPTSTRFPCDPGLLLRLILHTVRLVNADSPMVRRYSVSLTFLTAEGLKAPLLTLPPPHQQVLRDATIATQHVWPHWFLSPSLFTARHPKQSTETSRESKRRQSFLTTTGLQAETARNPLPLPLFIRTARVRGDPFSRALSYPPCVHHQHYYYALVRRGIETAARTEGSANVIISYWLTTCHAVISDFQSQSTLCASQNHVDFNVTCVTVE